MVLDWKGIIEKLIVSLVAAGVLGFLALFWNWSSSGGLVRLLGGVPANEFTDEVTRQVTQRLEKQAGEITITKASFVSNSGFAIDFKDLELRKYLERLCNKKPRCDIDTSSEGVLGIYSLYDAVSVTYACNYGKIINELKQQKGSVLVLSCLPKG